MVRSTDGTPGDRPGDRGGTQGDRSGESSPLISAKEETIRVLEAQLEAEREASAELRRIVAGLVQRVPEIEGPAEPREPSEAVREPSAGTSTSPDQEGLPWWKRFFGFST